MTTGETLEVASAAADEFGGEVMVDGSMCVCAADTGAASFCIAAILCLLKCLTGGAAWWRAGGKGSPGKRGGSIREPSSSSTNSLRPSTVGIKNANKYQI